MEKPAFDPNAACAPNGNYFAFPYTVEESPLILISVPWDVTTSYRPGTSLGPEAINRASAQLDFFDFEIPQAWTGGIATWPLENSENILKLSAQTRPLAEKLIFWEEKGIENCSQTELQEREKTQKKVAQACAFTNHWLRNNVRPFLEKGKKIGLVGGDHSSPLGLIQSLAEKYSDFGILHFDAHDDLRDSYENFEFSHASIMFNTLKIKQVSKLIQIGIRDVCQNEQDFASANANRIVQFPDYLIQRELSEGRTWKSICEQIIQTLPSNVYISFDIDVLEPSLCPHTGTPVPGGLNFGQVRYLLSQLRQSGKEIIGFDLCEVAPNPKDPEDEWDGNVGARVLYMLCNTLLFSGKRN